VAVVPLKIFIHGLIALAPSSDPGQFTALLVDARTPHAAVAPLSTMSPHPAGLAHDSSPPSADCEAGHWPKLRFAIPRTAEAVQRCKDAHCAVRDFVCECLAEALEGKAISLHASTAIAAPQTQLSAQAPGELPENAVEAGSVGYVANLTRAPFALALKPDYLSAPPQGHLLARMVVPFTRLTACSLAKRWDKGTANIHSMAFRRLGDVGDASEKSQALAQMVVAEADLEEIDGGLPVVELKIHDFADGSDHPIEVRAGDDGFVIFLSNDMEELAPGQPCDDGIARHFAHYFPFASNPPVLEDQLIPHLRFTQFKFSGGLKPAACDYPTSTMNDRPICPMASFF
jgi:hypothetical protein